MGILEEVLKGKEEIIETFLKVLEGKEAKAEVDLDGIEFKIGKSKVEVSGKVRFVFIPYEKK